MKWSLLNQEPYPLLTFWPCSTTLEYGPGAPGPYSYKEGCMENPITEWIKGSLEEGRLRQRKVVSYAEEVKGKSGNETVSAGAAAAKCC